MTTEQEPEVTVRVSQQHHPSWATGNTTEPWGSQIQYSEPTQGTSMGLTSSDPCVLGAPITNVWQHLQAGGRPLTVQPGLLEKSKANWPVWELNLRPWLHYHLVKTIEPLSR